MNYDELKKTEIFKGHSLEKLIQTVFLNSMEERDSALAVFDAIKAKITDGDGIDSLLVAEKPKEYLETASKSTDNINKLLTVIQKLMQTANTDDKGGIDKDDILDIISKVELDPKNFLDMDNQNGKIKELKNFEVVDEPKKNNDALSSFRMKEGGGDN